MNYPSDQIEELKRHCDQLSFFEEANVPYFKLEGLRLPEGCEPTRTDALLCPKDRGDGYPSRIFFPAQIRSTSSPNWHINERIGEANWVAFSWKVGLTDPTLAETLVELLKAFTRVW